MWSFCSALSNLETGSTQIATVPEPPSIAFIVRLHPSPAGYARPSIKIAASTIPEHNALAGFDVVCGADFSQRCRLKFTVKCPIKPARQARPQPAILTKHDAPAIHGNSTKHVFIEPAFETAPENQRDGDLLTGRRSRSHPYRFAGSN